MIDRVPGPRRTGPSIIITAVTKQLGERVPSATAKAHQKIHARSYWEAKERASAKTPSAGPCHWDTCSLDN